jgi:hypothetical protein
MDRAILPLAGLDDGHLRAGKVRFLGQQELYATYFAQTYAKADHVADKFRQWALGDCPPKTPVRDMARHCRRG